MSQSNLILTNEFADGTTRALTMGPFSPSAIHISDIKTAVKDLNANPSIISSLYLSKGGASFTGVKQVKISTANEVTII